MSSEAAIFKAKVNGFIALVFVGTVTLGLGLIIWHTAFGNNPVEDAMASYVTAEQQLSQ